MVERIKLLPLFLFSLTVSLAAVVVPLGYVVHHALFLPESRQRLFAQFVDPVQQVVLLRSLTLPIVVAIFSGIAGSMAGIAYLSEKKAIRLIVIWILVIPIAVHPVVLVFAFLGVLRQGYVADAINAVGSLLMIHGGSWLSVTMVMTFFLSSYVGWFVLLALGRIPEDELKAAWNAGSSRFQMAKWVILPRSYHALYGGTILAFVQATGFFIVPVLLGDGWVNTLPVFIADRLGLGMVSEASSYAVILFVVVFVCLIVSLRPLVRVWTTNA